MAIGILGGCAAETGEAGAPAATEEAVVVVDVGQVDGRAGPGDRHGCHGQGGAATAGDGVLGQAVCRVAGEAASGGAAGEHESHGRRLDRLDEARTSGPDARVRRRSASVTDSEPALGRRWPVACLRAAAWPGRTDKPLLSRLPAAGLAR